VSSACGLVRKGASALALSARFRLMSGPLVSILINNYNYARFLGVAIDSALTAIFKENGGQASSFNAGVSACRRDILCFLDRHRRTFRPLALFGCRPFERGWFWHSGVQKSAHKLTLPLFKVLDVAHAQRASRRDADEQRKAYDGAVDALTLYRRHLDVRAPTGMELRIAGGLVGRR
jgi:glycosyltransferase involved in cell wall biosynthesis